MAGMYVFSSHSWKKKSCPLSRLGSTPTSSHPFSNTHSRTHASILETCTQDTEKGHEGRSGIVQQSWQQRGCLQMFGGQVAPYRSQQVDLPSSRVQILPIVVDKQPDFYNDIANWWLSLSEVLWPKETYFRHITRIRKCRIFFSRYRYYVLTVLTRYSRYFL